MRSAADENRCYFRQAYETGRQGWGSTEPSRYVTRNLASVAQATAGRRLLDLSCGEGRHCVLAARMGFQAVGVDYESLAVARARENARQADLAGRVHFVVGDALMLPLAPASFDVAVDYGLLHHQKKADWPRYLAAVTGVLTPEGCLLLSVFSTRFRTYGPQRRPWHLAHGAYRRFFTAADLHALFDRAFEFLRLEQEREGARGFWHALLKRRAR
jgi:cyclopropane fatty-acyl-phospholipid synthase-like methyltransferase